MSGLRGQLQPRPHFPVARPGLSLIVFLVVMIAACLTTVTAALSPWPAVPLACAASCMLQVLTGEFLAVQLKGLRKFNASRRTSCSQSVPHRRPTTSAAEARIALRRGSWVMAPRHDVLTVLRVRLVGGIARYGDEMSEF